jgi:serine/threonine protein kinase
MLPARADVFPVSKVHPWEEERFKKERKLGDATRNRGVVHLRRDIKSDQVFAVKEMPNTWVRDNHDDFVYWHPEEIEMPWKDIGYTHYLNSVNYKYACTLHGVYRDSVNTFVMLSCASGGDLFSVATTGENPGPAREASFAPIVVELLRSLKQLHNMQIVHRDISLENVLLTSSDIRKSGIRIIDFGMSSTMRTFRERVGKALYQAPEMHNSSEHDAFLADMFAAGVLIFTLMVRSYPWQSTKTGRCKYFEYAQKHGWRAYFAERTVGDSDMSVNKCLSEPLLQLIEGMLAMDPANRLTLGEKVWAKKRRSVWDEPWIRNCTWM